MVTVSSKPIILYMRLRLLSPYHFTYIYIHEFILLFYCLLSLTRSFCIISAWPYKYFHICFTSHTAWSHTDTKEQPSYAKVSTFRAHIFDQLELGLEKNHHSLKKLPAHDAASKSNLTQSASDNISTGKFIVPWGLQCTVCLDNMKKDPDCSQCYMIEGQATTHIN